MFCHGLINGKRHYKPKQIACQGDLYARLQQILFKHEDKPTFYLHSTVKSRANCLFFK